MKIQLPQGQAIAGPGLVPVMTAIPAVTTVMACGAEEWAHFRYPSLCPFCGTAHGRLPEWPKGTVCKTVGSAYVGSNPTPATTCGNGPLAGNSRLCGPFSFVPMCVTLSRCRPSCCGVHGRIADDVRACRAVGVTAGFPRTATDGPSRRRVLS